MRCGREGAEVFVQEPVEPSHQFEAEYLERDLDGNKVGDRGCTYIVKNNWKMLKTLTLSK